MFNFNKQNKIKEDILDIKSNRETLQNFSSSQKPDDRPGRKYNELDMIPDDRKEDFEIDTLPNKYKAEPTDDSWMNFGEEEEGEVNKILEDEFQDYVENSTEMSEIPKESYENVSDTNEHEEYQSYKDNKIEKTGNPNYKSNLNSRLFDAFLKEKHIDLYNFKKELEEQGLVNKSKLILTKQSRAYSTFWSKIFSEENLRKFSTWKKNRGKK